MLREHEIEIRVRYKEADPMGVLHHANYFMYFEMGRIEMLRASGGDYRKMEEEGLLIVVVKAECRFRAPARFDDVLKLRTRVKRITQAKIEHEYRLTRDGDELAVAQTTVACVDRNGKIQPIPEYLQQDDSSATD